MARPRRRIGPEMDAGPRPAELPKATGLGVALSAVNQKNLLPCVSAGLVIGTGGLGPGEAVVALVIFTVMASSVLIPVLGYALAAQRLREPLDALSQWLRVNNHQVMALVLVIMGAAVIAKDLGPEGVIRCDADARWDVDTAAAAIPALDRAAGGLEFVEQPCGGEHSDGDPGFPDTTRIELVADCPHAAGCAGADTSDNDAGQRQHHPGATAGIRVERTLASHPQQRWHGSQR